MNNHEIDAHFKIASEFAEFTYSELHHTSPDMTNENVLEWLDMIMQAWLSGYNYLRNSAKLQEAIEQTFGFYINENL